MAATIRCARCGATNLIANQFCSNCGVPLSGSAQPLMAQTLGPMMWPPLPARSTSNVTVLIVILVIVIGVVLVGVAAVLIGRQIANTLPPGTGNPRFMGISVGRSADGTNWTLLITSVPSGLAPTAVRLTIITSGGSTALASTSFASLNYAVDRAAYDQAQPGGTVAVADQLLISTVAYPTGYGYQISESTGILAEGMLG